MTSFDTRYSFLSLQVGEFPLLQQNLDNIKNRRNKKKETCALKKLSWEKKMFKKYQGTLWRLSKRPLLSHLDVWMISPEFHIHRVSYSLISDRQTVCITSATGCFLILSVSLYRRFTNPPRSVYCSFIKAALNIACHVGLAGSSKAKCKSPWKSPW